MSANVVDIVFQVIVFMFAISVHESAHAWTASRLGDPTARMLGRVTLNPIKHIDPLGTIVLPLLAMLYHFPVIGWAKPTPVDPRHFRHPVRDDILTSVAGPLSNFLIATGAVLLLAFMAVSSSGGRGIVRMMLMGGAAESTSPLMPVAVLLYEAMTINVLLGIFNLIPIPPLDGSHVLRHMLPDSVRQVYDRIGMIGLILFFVVGGSVIGALMNPVVSFFNYLLVRMTF
jgi:Zn-dependent protease